MNSEKKRLAVFCSGAGSNFQALYRGIQEHSLPAEIVLCLSNRSQCGAMQFASEHDIEPLHLSEKQFDTYEAFSSAMLKALQDRRIDYILLAGYLKQIPPKVVSAYPKRMLNIHPALLPKFGGDGMYGMNVHRAVIAAGEKQSGPTVHFVDEGYDTGEIFMQRAIDIAPDDTPETLAAKVLKVEHVIYTDALAKLLRRSERR
ncbi:MAG: phosphoribosylglycinamide formyltransferase [Chlorobiales bacterium]|jgi:phosphoribosylglycinamide formyltransferase 1|nr:phosphoribosylglycinamide formyltransferase [Chlorobiales bacterium]